MPTKAGPKKRRTSKEVREAAIAEATAKYGNKPIKSSHRSGRVTKYAIQSKVKIKPRFHPSHATPMRKPQGVSAVVLGVEKHLEGADLRAALHKFQEECPHTEQRVIATIQEGETKKTLFSTCECGQLRRHS